MATAKKAPQRSTRQAKRPAAKKVTGPEATAATFYMTVVFTALCLTFLAMAVRNYAL